MAHDRTDEHGEVILDPLLPPGVVSDEQVARWDKCMDIAMAVTRTPATHPEARNFASVLYRSAIPTEDQKPMPPPRGRLHEARGHLPDPEELRRLAQHRRRNRVGRFADEFGQPRRLPDGTPEPKRLSVRMPNPARSPGVTQADIDALGLNDWPQVTDIARALMNGKENTVEAYRHDDPTGLFPKGKQHHPYSEERRIIHDRAVGRALAGLPTRSEGPTGVAELLGVNHPLVTKLASGGRLTSEEKEVVRSAAQEARGASNPDALFTAGGPASGKTTVLRENRDQLRPANAVTVDADALKEALPEYTAMRSSGDEGTRRYAATSVHEESGDLAMRLNHEAMNLGLNIVFDGTGDGDEGEFVKHLTRKRNAGYDVRVLYVTAPTEDAVSSAVSRAEEEGRFVPIQRVRELHAAVSRVFNDEISKLDWLEKLDVFERRDHIASGGGGNLHVWNRKKLDNFAEKAGQPPVAPEQAVLTEADNMYPTRSAGAPKVPPTEWTVEDPWDYDYLDRPLPYYAGDAPEDDDAVGSPEDAA
jgi:predicted ABC-type ATPase